ncbi:hypothetical protein LIA77_03348 [Sarocladium implicatum]|nr:hypothetical protein LIA77_03348 [Sarocladium implicatum]
MGMYKIDEVHANIITREAPQTQSKLWRCQGTAGQCSVYYAPIPGVKGTQAGRRALDHREKPWRWVPPRTGLRDWVLVGWCLRLKARYTSAENGVSLAAVECKVLQNELKLQIVNGVHTVVTKVLLATGGRISLQGDPEESLAPEVKRIEAPRTLPTENKALQIATRAAQQSGGGDTVRAMNPPCMGDFWGHWAAKKGWTGLDRAQYQASCPWLTAVRAHMTSKRVNYRFFAYVRHIPALLK